MGFMLLF